LIEDNKIVNGLWIGKSLSSIELLCIKSFLANGHDFYLWVYDQIETKLPEGTIVKDATEIILRENVFCYKNTNQYGHGKGSYAGFSDIFRYKLLYEKGGWWVDMDVVCLKPLDFYEPYVFRTHHEFAIVGNIMKCEKNSEVMRICYEKATRLVDENNRDWNLPIRVLNETVQELRLEHYIKEISNPDSWLYIRKLLLCKYLFPNHWYALHLVNEEWRHHRIDKKSIPRKSYLGKLLKQYDLLESSPLYKRTANILRLFIIRFSFKQIVGLGIMIFWKTIRVFKKEKPQKP